MTTRRELLIALGAGALAAPFGASRNSKARFGASVFCPRGVARILSTTTIRCFPAGNARARLCRGQEPGDRMAVRRRRVRAPSRPGGGIGAVESGRHRGAGPPAISGGAESDRHDSHRDRTGVDPVGAGFVKSLARPGGNITGFSNLAAISVPSTWRCCYYGAQALSRGGTGESRQLGPSQILKSVQAAAQKVGVKVVPVEAQTPQEIENAFSLIPGRTPVRSSWYLTRFSFSNDARSQSRQQSIGCRPYRDSGICRGRRSDELRTEPGGHLPARRNVCRQNLQGRKPGDLPVEQPTNSNC